MNLDVSIGYTNNLLYIQTLIMLEAICQDRSVVKSMNKSATRLRVKKQICCRYYKDYVNITYSELRGFVFIYVDSNTYGFNFKLEKDSDLALKFKTIIEEFTG